jgi:hypothetical protein
LGPRYGDCRWGSRRDCCPLPADAAPEHLRGTAFGTYELAVGVAAFIANAGAGALWMFSGPRLTFGVGAAIAAATLLICSLARLRKPSGV